MKKIKSLITKDQLAVLKLIEKNPAKTSKELAILSGVYTEIMIKGHCHKLYIQNMIGLSVEVGKEKRSSCRHLYVITQSGRNALEGVDLRVSLDPKHVVNSVFSLGTKCAALE